MMIVYNSKSIDARILASFLRYHGRMVRISIFAGDRLASSLDMRMGRDDLDFRCVYKAVIDAMFECPGEKYFFKIEPLDEDKKMNKSNFPEDIPEYNQFDKNCADFLSVVSQMLERLQAKHSGMTSEEIALQNVKAGLTLWLSSRRVYIENYKDLKNE